MSEAILRAIKLYRGQEELAIGIGLFILSIYLFANIFDQNELIFLKLPLLYVVSFIFTFDGVYQMKYGAEEKFAVALAYVGFAGLAIFLMFGMLIVSVGP